ncbi:HAMP domain-containing histidine kinase [Candidatus Sumerlaeota bacterium]|nr:HAMP domain-containing histidine kinase [Candidatus Sumerlaeota bacterium]
MARHTVLARLQERLAARINQGSPMTGWELVRYACAELVAQQAAVFAGAVELAEEGAGRLRWTSRWAIERSGGTSPSPEDEPLAKIMAEAMAGLSDRPVWLGTVNSPRAFVGRWVNDPERPGVRYGLAIALGSPARPAESASAESLLNRFAAIIYGGLEALQGRNRTLVRERDRVGINLSRNLGHDLTNIIAASKLELMTLEELLGGGDVPAAGPRREILSESLQGLLNSTKFLQEIVNLYRAYAFLKEPTLETHDPNDLIADTARLFRLSTSEKVRVIERLDPSAPRFRVDPRLFKLALFNLLANAVDAIRRGPGREGDQGTITISSAASPGNGGANSACGGVTITVEDSGPGILNESGSLASAEEIERIFQLGFTLGREGKGEGLGLNWVRTIVRDIHGGTIRASNAPEGGARFTLEFPPIEYAPTA